MRTTAVHLGRVGAWQLGVRSSEHTSIFVIFPAAEGLRAVLEDLEGVIPSTVNPAKTRPGFNLVSEHRITNSLQEEFEIDRCGTRRPDRCPKPPVRVVAILWHRIYMHANIVGRSRSPTRFAPTRVF